MKNTRLKHALSASLVSLSFGVSVSSANTIDNIVVLGDSLSDMGRLNAASGGALVPDPPYWQGRQTNGPVWAESLASRLGAGLTNYAIAGAKTNDENVWDRKDPLVEFGGVQNQLTEYLGDGPDTAALHIIWAGSNNFLSIPDDPVSAITEAVTDIVTTVKTLSDTGADQVQIIGVPDFGLSPRLIESGLTEQGTALANSFNAALLSGLDMSGFGDVPFFDSAALLRMVVADPEAYGFTNVTEPVCTDVPDTWCSIDESLPADEYLFWDSVHPTRVVHAIIGEELARELAAVPEPGSFALLMVGLIGLASSRMARRVT